MKTPQGTFLEPLKHFSRTVLSNAAINYLYIFQFVDYCTFISNFFRCTRLIHKVMHIKILAALIYINLKINCYMVGLMVD